MGAANLQSLAPILDTYNVKLIGVGIETLGHEEFLAESGWREVLLCETDDRHALYRQLGTLQNSWRNCFGLGAFPIILKWARKASQLGFTNNLAGNKSLFGGTFAFDASGTCVYAHRQDGSSFEPDIAKMLAALGVSTDDIQKAMKGAYPEKVAVCRSKDQCTR